MSLERNVIIRTSRNIHELRANLRSTYEIDGGFAAPEAADLKNVLAVCGSYYRKRVPREYVTSCHPRALRLMSLDGRHLRNHIRNTPLKRQFHAIPFVMTVRMRKWKNDVKSKREDRGDSFSLHPVTYTSAWIKECAYRFHEI